MKKFKSILAIVILAAISYSCNNSAVLKVMEEPETGIIVSDENKAKFEDQINTFRTFTKAFHDEDINQLMSVVADSIQWSPPEYNGGETVGYDGFKAVVSAYFENFDEITFNEAEGLIGSDNAYWSGSLYSTGEIKGKKVAIWGLAFKPNTDDIREAPALEIITNLLAEGCEVAAYDPEAMGNVEAVFGDKVTFCKSMYKATENADFLIIATEWSVFRTPDFEKLAKNLKDKTIFDGRNIYEKDQVKELGFSYFSIGRP